jgi:hypothetical protein
MGSTAAQFFAVVQIASVRPWVNLADAAQIPPGEAGLTVEQKVEGEPAVRGLIQNLVVPRPGMRARQHGVAGATVEQRTLGRGFRHAISPHERDRTVITPLGGGQSEKGIRLAHWRIRAVTTHH